MRAALLAVTVVVGAREVAAEPKPVSPVAITGPYKSILDACLHAPPCGFTDLDPKTLKEIKPQKTATCPSLAGGDVLDPNSDGINGTRAVLHHKSKELEMQIGSQHCATPEGIRGEHDIYFVFVKRGDGWWRSAPVWQWDYNERYSSGGMVVRWNDQPGRTFAGVAASQTELVCNKQGYATETLELMVRVEPGDKTPIVFTPVVVGERSQVEPIGEVAGCQRTKHSIELDEKWTGSDDLELTGAATWSSPGVEDGLMSIGLGSDVPSSVGRYHFTR